MIEVLATGPFASVQDLGRSGHAAMGVPHSGAFDPAALRLANRLVGNAEHDAGIEVTLGGLSLRVLRACTLAGTGADCDGLDWGRAITLRAGATVTLSAPRTGLRSYLAVRGGIEVDPVLGSRSTDTMSGLGPPPLGRGVVLQVGRPDGAVSGESVWPDLRARAVRVDPGPRTDWFDGDVLATLAATQWTVRGDSDRIGVRLDGPRLVRTHAGELPSEPTIVGAVQVPPDGRPIVFGPDAPVTGGYPVIGVVADLAVLAQARPGDTVRFVRR